MDLIGSLIALATSQHDVVVRRQGLELGLSRNQVDRLFARQGWPRVHGRARALPGSRPSPLRDLHAALLLAPPGSAVTGRSGLWLRGHLTRPPRTHCIVIPMTSTTPVQPTGVRFTMSRTWDPASATVVQRMRTAPAARCLVDHGIAPHPTLDATIDLLLTVLQQRATTIPAILATLDACAGHPGIPVLNRAITEVGTTGADSPFVHRVHRRLVAEGLRPDPFPEPVETPDVVLHPDITFTRVHRRRASVECDGLAFHGGHREQALDARKDRAYRAARHVNRRIGWWDFRHNWDEFVADLRRAIDTAPTTD